MTPSPLVVREMTNLEDAAKYATISQTYLLQLQENLSCSELQDPGNGCELLKLRDTEFGSIEASQILTISRLLI